MVEAVIVDRALLIMATLHERDGMLTRTAQAEVPPRVEYELTDLAESLIPHAVALADGASDHVAAIEAHRDEFDRRTERGR
ncbi:winged helix-turn-helix transcriptional regulator [Microbacterium sp.]|uniref:winged helix-turn-helix transcriptional regulator n=1 Tax=Microbacterium sp. TaxID=51671 RepID=UPI0027F31D1B|nr:helix-turn-helix transcriptional regulator [Microbacterium sp.]